MDKVMYKVLFLLIVFFIVSPNEADAKKQEYHSFLSVTNFTFESSTSSRNRTIIYHGTSQERGEKILFESSKIIGMLPEFLPELDTQCKYLDLHIYQIDHSVLNNRDIMSFLAWESWRNNDLSAVYDSKASPRGTATIFITARDYGTKETSHLSHEITHYWQDTMCRKLNEKQAYEFESFYSKSTR
jgi:hypothetical protein